MGAVARTLRAPVAIPGHVGTHLRCGAMVSQVSTFGEQLRAYRERAGLTQEELAERAGLTVHGISALERGTRRRPYPHTVRVLCDALALTSDERTDLAALVPRSGPAHSPTTTPVSNGALHGVLPHSITSLIGRERDLLVIRGLLEQSGVRLLALTGPGGIGKTRLAIAVASDLARTFLDGVVWVPLATIRSPDLVANAIAAALHMPTTGDRPVAEILRDFLRDRHLLLVLDNFEHVLAAAPLVTGLLASSPRLQVLVTSRARLHVRGEHDYAVPPLELPDRSRHLSADQLATIPALRLFLERAREIDQGESEIEDAPVIAAICERLDGLPLAIELAAARVNVLPPAVLLARLEPRLPLLTRGQRDLPDRLQTMRSAIAWSYNLLTPTDQTVFHCLSAFVGGFSLEAAEAVCAPSIGSGSPSRRRTATPDRSLDAVESLMRQSLLRRQNGTDGEPRFTMLETIREYGLEQLAESGKEDEVRRRHAWWCVALAEEADPQLDGFNSEAWLDRLEADHANFRSALAWLQAQGKSELALRLGGALSTFWCYRGHYVEGRAHLQELLALPEASAFPRPWARTMSGFGFSLTKVGQYEPAAQLHERAVAVWRDIGTPQELHYALWCLGYALSSWDPHRATEVFTESLAISRTLEFPWTRAQSLWGLGRAARYAGDLDQASDIFTQLLALARDLDHPLGKSMTLLEMGIIALAKDEAEQAIALLAGSLRVLQHLLEHWGTMTALDNIAAALDAVGQPEPAARIFGAVETLRASLGLPRPPVDRPPIDRSLAHLRAALDERSFAAAFTAGAQMTLNETIAEALSVSILLGFARDSTPLP